MAGRLGLISPLFKRLYTTIQEASFYSLGMGACLRGSTTTKGTATVGGVWSRDTTVVRQARLKAIAVTEEVEGEETQGRESKKGGVMVAEKEKSETDGVGRENEKAEAEEGRMTVMRSEGVVPKRAAAPGRKKDRERTVRREDRAKGRIRVVARGRI